MVFLLLLAVVFVVYVPMVLYFSLALATEISGCTSFAGAAITASKSLVFKAFIISSASFSWSIESPTLSPSNTKVSLEGSYLEIEPFFAALSHLAAAAAA